MLCVLAPWPDRRRHPSWAEPGLSSPITAPLALGLGWTDLAVLSWPGAGLCLLAWAGLGSSPGFRAGGQ